jgi:hypothetical protein
LALRFSWAAGLQYAIAITRSTSSSAHYQRGHITVLERPKLEALCCECYARSDEYPSRKPVVYHRQAKALERHNARWLDKRNLDGNAAIHRALRIATRKSGLVGCGTQPRYLNNIVEQTHRAIRQRCAPMLSLKSFRTAAIMLEAEVRDIKPVRY